MIWIGEAVFDGRLGEVSAEVRVGASDDTATQRRRMFPLNARERRVWYRTAPEFARFLTWERSDGFVMHHLLRALTEGHDIAFETPMSQSLYDGLTTIVIPLICSHVPDAWPVRLSGPVTEEPLPSAGAVATFCSGGVDSTYSIFTHQSSPTRERLTHLLCFDVGAFGDTSEPQAAEARDRTFRTAKAIADAPEVGLPLVTLESNLTHGAAVGHLMGEGFANIGGALLLQKLMARCYCPSGGLAGAKLPAISLLHSSDLPLWGGGACSTATLRILPDDVRSRKEKLAALVGYPPAQRHLSVDDGLSGERNSGVRPKSVRTLLLLEELGDEAVGHFADRFDMAAFRAHRREVLREQLKSHLSGQNHFWLEFRDRALAELSWMDHLRLAKWYWRAFWRKAGVRRRKRFASLEGK